MRFSNRSVNATRFPAIPVIVCRRPHLARLVQELICLVAVASVCAPCHGLDGIGHGR